MAGQTITDSTGTVVQLTLCDQRDDSHLIAFLEQFSFSCTY